MNKPAKNGMIFSLIVFIVIQALILWKTEMCVIATRCQSDFLIDFIVEAIVALAIGFGIAFIKDKLMVKP